MREERVKHVGSRDINKGSMGHQTGKWSAQNLSPTLGTIVGQSPSCYREQNVWPSVGNARDDERVKGTGLGREKIEGLENYCLTSLQRRTTLRMKQRSLKKTIQHKWWGRNRSTTKSGVRAERRAVTQGKL